MQNNIQFKKSKEQSIEDAVELLNENGYIVIQKNKLKSTSVKKASDLVDYFYSLLQYYNQDRDIHYSSSKKDLRLAKNFIKSRRGEKELNNKRAICEAASIVKCVIKYESKFGFKSPIKSLSCFGQDGMKWVTDKAISIINREETELEKEAFHLYMDNLYVEQEEEAIKLINRNKIDDLKSILGGLQDGEEKENGGRDESKNRE